VIGVHGPASEDAGNRHDEEETTLDALHLFLGEIRRVPLLSAADEVRMARRIEEGDRAARDLMIRANLRLVMAVARRYQRSGLPLLDLAHEGVFGLMDAVDRFDWRRGYRFSTYATWSIRHTIRYAISTKARVIRLPVRLAERAYTIAGVEARLTTELGRTPTDAEIAHAGEVRLCDLQELRKLARPVASLEEPAGFGEARASVGDLLTARDEEPFDEVVARLGRDELSRALERALPGLSDRERQVIDRRFGIDGAEPETLAELGRQLGVTRERVRQLEVAALERLAQVQEVRVLRDAELTRRTAPGGR
jgi:RNA polymerase primary sigma factor